MIVDKAEIEIGVKIPDGDFAIEYPNFLTFEQAEIINRRLKEKYPNREILVLDGGAKVAHLQNQQLDRIEEMLRAVILLLTEEETEEIALDLEGNQLPAERDENQTL